MASTIIDRISEKIFGSPLAIKVERELAEETIATRRARAAELVTQEAAQLEAMRQHAADRVPLQADVDRLEVTLAQSRERLFEADRARQLAVFDETAAMDRLKADLRATASPAIHAFILELRTQVVAAHKETDSVSEHRVDGRDYLVWSNGAAVAARVAAIRHLLQDELSEGAPIWFAPLDEAGVAARLKDLRATLPAIDLRPAKYRSRE